MTLREDVMQRDGYRCQYCMTAKAVHLDHLIPKALRRRHHLPDDDPSMQVAACAPCNWRKGTLRRVPWNRRHLIPSLPGKDWRAWNGDPATLHAR